MLVASPRVVNPTSITQFPEWFLAGLMIAIGVRLLLPGATLSQPNYVYIQAYASEASWGMILLSIGVVRIAALLISIAKGTCIWTLHARAMIAFPSGFFFSKMGFLIHRANPEAILPIFCFSVALVDIVILYLVAFQAGLKDKRRRNANG